MGLSIGITERGDAGINLLWKEKLDGVDGAILITKNITPKFKTAVLKLVENNYPFIIHCTCTGWGGTYMEPNVPKYTDQLNALKDLINLDVDKSKCVLRIDPIIPTQSGFSHIKKVLEYADEIGLLPIRIRISIYDEYKHIVERLTSKGLSPLYKGSMYATWSMMQETGKFLSELYNKYNIPFETCAEPKLSQHITNSNIIESTGCVSLKDIELMGLDIKEVPNTINSQNRFGCVCLTCKKELLTERHPCPHKCLYCYWRD